MARFSPVNGRLAGPATTALAVNGNWNYAYDKFNRLASATPSSQSWWYTYDYDRYGNRWHQSLKGTGGSGNTSSMAFDAYNHITGTPGMAYDAAGNTMNDGAGNTYFYDAENRIIQVGGTLGNCSTATACYLYNAAGDRVRKTAAGSSVDYLYDPAGHVITELSSSGAWNRGEVFAGGHHIATYSGGTSGTSYFTHADWLGTKRVRTNVSAVVCETITNLPFGDGQATSGSCGDPSPFHFTGKQRDTETGNDDFGARYFNSSMARWLTPDWSARPAGVLP